MTAEVAGLQLGALLKSVRILSPMTFLLAGDGPLFARSDLNRYPFERFASPLTEGLARALYDRAYHRRDLRRSDDADSGSEPTLESRLATANPTSDASDPGWQVIAIDADGSVVVRKGERARLITPPEMNDSFGLDSPPRLGDALSLPIAAASTSLQPGFYYAVGANLADRFDDLVTLRVYFNTDAGAAPRLLGRLGGALNRFGVPYLMKFLLEQSRYESRSDGCVLYVPRRHGRFVIALALDAREEISGFGTETPLFTRRLAAGLALADDPPDKDSFGMSRCRLVAEGIVDAWRGGSQDGANRLEAVRRRFEAAGLDLERPWLNPGQVDIPLPPPLSPLPSPPRDGGFLSVADRIGCRLVRDAVWHECRCNWIGWGMQNVGGRSRPVLRSLGGDLYSGAAGVALLLGRLHRRTGDAAQAAAARGALRNALQRSDIDGGLFSGAAGVGYAAAEVGLCLNEEQWIEAGVNRVLEACSEPERGSSADIISGWAGTILVLLDFAGRFDRRDFLELAERLGWKLIESAQRTESGWGWRTEPAAAPRPLLGYSHGSAGIACALAALAAATGLDAFSQAAAEAMRYERNCYDPKERNWPDYREDSDASTGFMTAWCHGAPGIGFSRLRILQALGGGPELQEEISTALQTTEQWLRQLPRNLSQSTFCLCHGAAGNAELFVLAADVLGRPDFRAIAEEVAELGIEQFHRPDNPWPCGVAGAAETPDLMLGLAGIGHFYLRLDDPGSTPAPLSLWPGESQGSRRSAVPAPSEEAD